MIIPVTQDIRLVLVSEEHPDLIFAMVDSNRSFLRTWLPFADNMQSVDFAERFVKGSMQRNAHGLEYAFVIFEKDEPVGRIGVYKIDVQNSIGEIGYWLTENKQGKGIVTRACETLIRFCFETLNLNRIELKCGTENTKSMAVPIALSFTKEGAIRQGEWLHDRYIDLYLFSLLKTDWQKAGRNTPL